MVLLTSILLLLSVLFTEQSQYAKFSTSSILNVHGRWRVCSSHLIITELTIYCFVKKAKKRRSAMLCPKGAEHGSTFLFKLRPGNCPVRHSTDVGSELARSCGVSAPHLPWTAPHARPTNQSRNAKGQSDNNSLGLQRPTSMSRSRHNKVIYVA
jgi:hypothetical protein